MDKMNKKRVKQFLYGIDEYFLNYYLLPWIAKNNILYGCHIIWVY